VVGVLHLAKPGGDTLLDHAQVGRVQEAPAVATGSPRVVFSIFYVDGSRFVLASLEVADCPSWFWGYSEEPSAIGQRRLFNSPNSPLGKGVACD
jgi:hypothetical protein